VVLSNPVVSLIFKGGVAGSRIPRVLRFCCRPNHPISFFKKIDGP
jgi:hypothetical protein